MVMAIAEDMKKLTENIIISNDVRLKAVGEIVADTHKTLKGFATDRKKMSQRQAKDLADFVNGLSKNVQSLQKMAQNMVKEFQKSNKQMSKEQAKNLSEFVNDLTNSVGSMLNSFEKDRSKMSKELKDRLIKEIKDVQAQVEKILDDADKFVGECSSDIAQARKAWKTMSAMLDKARKAGFVMPEVKAGEKVTTVHRMPHGVGQATRRSKKKAVKKNKSNKQTVHAGV